MKGKDHDPPPIRSEKPNTLTFFGREGKMKENWFETDSQCKIILFGWDFGIPKILDFGTSKNAKDHLSAMPPTFTKTQVRAVKYRPKL